jgi:hypothetical protein
LKIFFALPRVISTPGGWIAALLGLVASAALGGALGLLYGGVRSLWRNWGDS